ncbi:DEAD/DEAH box helicase [Patescibacteria group bacterium]|nr:DEAD/DEAH box helicase [Patescibacteria group bacterium]MBU1682671.1 DEAD/DEAH box helicase [Patescibacteria group bacterium]MBU1935699.1 DEAD/DEAH box helicase [Patescibacteria group bacterium]
MHKQKNTEHLNELSFHNLGLDTPILKVLDQLKFHIPTPIQAQAIPDGLNGEDIIGVAQTGTGKTLAFSLPIIQRLIRHGGRGLILLPTRELALQVEEMLHKVAKSFGLRTVVIIGGAPMNRQVRDLRKKPHVIIGTPGRIINHIEDKTISLHDVSVLVLDEADRMLDMGFAPQIKKILHVVPKDRQTMLFSATMPTEIVEIATQYMKRPTHVEVARQGTTAEQVDQEIYIVARNQKKHLLEMLLKQYEGTALVFTRTKHGARKICRDINRMKHSAAEIHSNRSLPQRKQALEGFKNGKYRVLVATDIAARGIDVKDIVMVINYDVPEYAEDYVHRIGRTGRAGKDGHAITFIMPSQSDKLRKIERLIELKLSQTDLPKELPAPEHEAPKAHRERHGTRTSYSANRRGRNRRR